MIESLIDFTVIHAYKPNKYYDLAGNIFIGNLVIHIVFYGLSLAYIFSVKAVRGEQQKQRLIQEKLYSELTYLKSQVNPHFLFNTLNNLFSLARKNKDFETANGISKLSKMMRYMLYEGNTDKIMLSKEIDYIENYINLQKLRFHPDDDITIGFNYTGNIESFMIAPLLLIPFVENAFKHGISIQNHSYIMINVHVKGDVLEFIIRNTKHSADKNSEYSGFGLNNVQNRLQMLYENEHELIIKETDIEYQVTLILNH
ncbi:MAG: histidine kinase [Bacteroidetes bacterium]|nr:histidine kinase [Bacteroidota bacterium]